MEITKTENGYGVVHNGHLIVRDESMGVCDAILFAYRHEPSRIEDMTEMREISDCLKSKFESCKNTGNICGTASTLTLLKQSM